MKKYYLILIFVCVVFSGFADDVAQKNKEATKDSKPDSKSAEAYYKRGAAKCIKKQYKEAIKDYDKAIKLSPKKDVINKNVNLKPEQYLKAVNDSNNAVKLAWYYRGRGSAKYQLKLLMRLLKQILVLLMHTLI